MADQLTNTCSDLEKLLGEVEQAGLPIAAAHLSTALELLQAELRRNAGTIRPVLKVVSRREA